ncbi:hypothetical protein HYPSUDRAFT_43764 [Hypholoma sublateritium FD-334 SS-4]|uniref:DASH complex subunit DUO1 n=1 Tax=Hypholoma sublateritium (strain FD-334 SS-4) TaxID=945553 RepID=A0A0D2NLW4_HYPSF|nr:hypothetical protein HYPSUDRAFT_43764 [Hypholoma sublateritium FD-334 SS-4]
MADYSDSSSIDINASASESRLLSLDSPILSSINPYFNAGSCGEALSLSDLSLSDQTAITEKPFSLLARAESEPAAPTHNPQTTNPDARDENLSENSDDVFEKESLEKIQQQTTKLREEKLQSDIFILKKLNASFGLFIEALQDTGFASRRIAAQLEQTNDLLDKYVDILSKSEDFSRLIFDEQWHGADNDEETIERERLEEEKRIRQEKEAEALRAEQEFLRVEKEKEGQRRREETERVEREKSGKAIRGSIRGVRGTRASMRGIRGSALPRPGMHWFPISVSLT